MSGAFNFPAIQKVMRKEKVEPQDTKWLEASYQNHSEFLNSLFEYHSGQFSKKPASVLGEHYDFYSDMVLRHLPENRVAFRWYDLHQGWQHVTYQDLHYQVIAEENIWRQKGIQCGDKIAVVLPFGLKYIITTLVIFKIGLIPTFIPPRGYLFVSRRVNAAKAKHIYTDPAHYPMLVGSEHLFVANMQTIPTEWEEYIHKYPHDTALGHIFCPISKLPSSPKILLSHHAYCRAMSDSVFNFQIKPGDCIAAPDFLDMHYQPTLLIACLLTGATYLHLSIEQIKFNPNLLDEIPINALGISKELLQLLPQIRSEKLESLSHCFLNVEESRTWTDWDSFRQILPEETLATRYLYHVGMGGSILFSFPFKDQLSDQLFPSPGIHWQLMNQNKSSTPSLSDKGIFFFNEAENDQTPVGNITLHKEDSQYFYRGIGNPHRYGYTISEQEIELSLSHLEFILNIALITVPLKTHNYYILLVFLGEEEDWSPKISSRELEIKSAIQLQLGAEFIPDKIEFFPLYPRVKNNKVDIDWCREQYEQGHLHRKIKHNTYKALTQLRSCILKEK